VQTGPYLPWNGPHDVEGLDFFDFDLPEQSQIIGDKAYNDYELEDVLLEADLHLLPMRKQNSKRPFPPWMRYLQAHFRKTVETSGSSGAHWYRKGDTGGSPRCP
jgi:hypothetical protein